MASNSQSGLNDSVNKQLQEQDGEGESEQEPAIWPKPWNGPFRLFDLPPELRFRIYQHVLVSLTTMIDQTHLIVRMKNNPIVNALTVSRQFSREYWREAKGQMHLIVDDGPRYKWQFVKLQPRLAQNVRTLEVHVRTLCLPMYRINALPMCHVVEELQMHATWLLKLTRADLPALQSFTINVYLDEVSNSMCCRIKLLKHQKIFTTMEKMAALKVFHCTAREPWQNCLTSYFDHGRRLTMEYHSEADGLVEVGLEGAYSKRCL